MSNTKAAALLAEQQRKERQRRLLAMGGVGLVMVLIVAGAIALGVINKHKNDTKVEAAIASTSGTYGVKFGPDSATHHVVIYEDFLCPFCGALEKGTRSRIAQLAADGTVQVEYRPFDLLSRLGDYSARSAGAFSVVLDKAGPDVAKKFHDLLYENQPSEEGPYLSDEDLVKYAVEAGAKESQVKGPIESGAGLAWAKAATKAALGTGLQGTPTVVVDGHLLNDTTPDGLLAAIG
ncbi:DsbA family protein [Nocardioides montaniterrae]